MSIEISYFTPVLYLMIVLLSVMGSLATLSIHEALAGDRPTLSIVASKLRVLIKALTENSRLNVIVHIQVIAGLVLTAHFMGDINRNLEILMVGLLLISGFTYQLLKDAEKIDQVSLLNKVIETSTVLVLLSLAHLHTGIVQLSLVIVIYIFLEALSFKSTSIHPWHHNKDIYILEVFSTEIIKYWLITSVVISQYQGGHLAIKLMVATFGYYLLSLLIKPVVRGSIAKRLTPNNLVYRVLFSCLAIIAYAMIVLWRKS
tara:strand:+ start:644 stop:1420 length:777 start_codon:yes stop_codon:yes gene_type:complete